MSNECVIIIISTAARFYMQDKTTEYVREWMKGGLKSETAREDVPVRWV